MKLTKRIISVLLAVLMLVTVIPFSAFAEDDSAEPEVEQNVEYEANNAVGAMVLNAVSEEQNASGEYTIRSVEVQEKTAIADVSYLDSCTLVVAVYDNDGSQMLTSAKEELTGDTTLTDAQVELTFAIDEMPEYFTLKAFLLDWDLSPLCNVYTNIQYTREFEAFLAKTTDDFDADRVINLDDSETENFMVVSGDSKVIEPEDGSNTVVTDDYANGLYVIENADEQMKKLKKDDIFYYPYGDGEDDYIVGKVKSLRVDGDTVTIETQTVDSPSEVFDYVKIDIESSESTFDPTGMDESVTHERIETQMKTRAVRSSVLTPSATVEVKDKFSVDKKFVNTDNVEVKVTLSVSLGAAASLQIYIDKSLDLEGIELKIEYSAEFAIDVSAKFEIRIPLGQLGIDLKLLTAKIGPEFVFSVEGKLTLTKITFAKASLTIGYDDNQGFFADEKKPEVDLNDNELSAEIAVFVGLALTVKVKALFLVEAKAEISGGLEIKGEIEASASLDEIHSCGFCVDGTVSLKASAELSGKILAAHIDKKLTMLDVSVEILKFYFNPEMGFHIGTCPNRLFLTTIRVVNSSGKIVPYAKAWVKGDQENFKTSGDNGEISMYLPVGAVTVVVQVGDETKEKKIKVMPKKNKTTVRLDGDGGWGTDVEILESGTCGERMIWTLYADGELVIDGTGKMTDWESASDTPWNLIDYKIKKVTISDGVTSIGNYAFYFCESLTDISFSESIVSIGEFAFYACSSLTEILMPSSVKAIETGAFGYCTSLSKILIPDGVQSIGYWAFNNCTSLLDISIPDNVQAIDGVVFANCTSLENIVIGKNVSSISTTAFEGCVSLKYIKVSEANQYYSNDSSGVLFNKDKSLLMTYPIGNSRSEYIIPETVRDIESEAFNNCAHLTSILVDDKNQRFSNDSYGVLFDDDQSELIQYPIGNSRTEYTIPDSVIFTAKGAFMNCVFLENIVIGNSVESLGQSTFENCTSLKSITFPESVFWIGLEACSGCTALTSVTIPDSVTWIDQEAFYGCTSLKSVTIPDSVTSIDNWAFSSCHSLASVIIPDSVTSIGQGAFDQNRSLTSITVAPKNPNYSSDTFGVLFNKDKTELIQYPIGNSRAQYTIPTGVATINQFAFTDCTSLTSVIIPDSVTSFGWAAFMNCTSLETVYYSGNEEQWNAIDGNDGLTDATIVYNSTGPADVVPTSMTAAFPAADSDAVVEPILMTASSVTDEPVPASCSLRAAAYALPFGGCRETLNSAVVGDSYVMLVVKNAYASDLLAPENLLYIDQKTADSETLTFDFVPREDTEYKALFFSANLSAGSSEHEHSYDTVVTAPTCTEKGYTTYICAGCGDSYIADETDALGHDFGEWKTVNAATCMTEGNAERSCSRCDAVEEKVLPKTDHDYAADITEATCTEDGSATYTCSVCGDTYTEILPATGHDYVKNIIEPTCTEDGFETYVCSVCGDDYGEVLPATGHTPETIKGKAATCTEKGLTDGSKCSVCGTILTAQTEIPATGHKPETIKGKAATCTEKGLTDGSKCSVCGTVLTAQNEIPATGHKPETVKGKAATCTEKGLTDGSKCSVCGTVLTKQTEIPATGHAFGEWSVIREATMSQEGLRERVCSVCGEKENETIAKLTPTYLLGDVDGNGVIAATDARLALRIAASLETVSGEAQALAADINGDGVIRASDARIILRVCAHLESIDDYLPEEVPPADNAEQPAKKDAEEA